MEIAEHAPSGLYLYKEKDCILFNNISLIFFPKTC